ncbi:MAG: type IV toxin-antitoxin system AbiEi family antitoxin domain-containing protein [Planctomycetia bacterium]|nr:type IV toxin-antitoxin system AbiEi family antitoxin domain-containing protein [Planctomycetia bacterium]
MHAETTERDTTDVRKARAAFRRHGGILRMAEALREGIHRRTLYAMRDAGQVETLARGLYRLADAEPLANPDLVTVAAKVPNGVVYLISALAFHEITTQIPHEVCIAVPRNSEPPRLDYPPIRVVRLSPAPYEAGIETHKLDGVTVKVYSREKTLADCFKHRNEIGLDTVLEAVRMYKAQRRVDVDTIMRYAAVCRVAQVARPYLEALL